MPVYRWPQLLNLSLILSTVCCLSYSPFPPRCDGAWLYSPLFTKSNFSTILSSNFSQYHYKNFSLYPNQLPFWGLCPLPLLTLSSEGILRPSWPRVSEGVFSAEMGTTVSLRHSFVLYRFTLDPLLWLIWTFVSALLFVPHRTTILPWSRLQRPLSSGRTERSPKLSKNTHLVSDLVSFNEYKLA